MQLKSYYPGVILYRASIAALIVCVAAIASAVSSCSSSSSAPTTPPPTPSSVATSDFPATPLPTPQTTATSPTSVGTRVPGYDEWALWNSGESSPEFLLLIKAMGLTTGAFPTADYYNRGFIGVAKLGTKCIISFTKESVTSEANLSVVIFSRFDPYGLEKIENDLSIPQIRVLVDEYRHVCSV
jgi:hypothetical protein